MGAAKYLKAAFMYHWNLLAFLGGMGFALLSGLPGVFCPLVLAGEVAYLGLLGSHAKFQRYVDAQKAQATRQQASGTAEQAVQRILGALPDNLVRRFETLRARCLELRQIGQDLKDPNQAGPLPLEELQLAGLDRLLWIFLRLLYTNHMLERFFQRTSEADVQRDIQRLEERLRRVAEGPEDDKKQKVRRALEDSLATCRERLANLQKARDNSELVQLEIERLENKIRSLSELAINRQEPAFISSQVDAVASSMLQTEQTMNELQFATGLNLEEDVPQLVQRQGLQAQK